MLFVRRALLVLAVAYVGVCSAVYMGQRGMLFLPAESTVTPEDAGLAITAEVALTTSNNEILVSWYQAARPGRPTILFFHGNGGSLAHRGSFFREFSALGFGIFAVGYPGYGGNPGDPSEAAFIETAFLAYDKLNELGVNGDTIVAYGESLGTAVAVQLAAKRTVFALVLEAPMSSVADIAADQYPFLPVRQLIKDPFLSIDHIEDVDAPILIVHGDRDTLIPIESGRKLFAAAGEPKTFHTVAGATHALRANVMRPIVAGFLDSL